MEKDLWRLEQAFVVFLLTLSLYQNEDDITWLDLFSVLSQVVVEVPLVSFAGRFNFSSLSVSTFKIQFFLTFLKSSGLLYSCYGSETSIGLGGLQKTNSNRSMGVEVRG